MGNKAIPTGPQRVLLVNPTKYLGNLLLAGGLMQDWVRHCVSRNIDTRIVLDESFRGLCENAFPAGTLVFFPRARINKAGFLKKLALYRDCLEQLRGFHADIAFAIEDDAATSHLTRLSGAAFKVGCSPLRHRRGYDHVVPVQFEQRPAGREHRWYSYYEVFAALGMAEPQPSYLDLEPGAMTEHLKDKLRQAGWADDKPTVALHAGATKDYKKWPLEHMATLAESIQASGRQAVLIGAGSGDKAANDAIRSMLESRHSPAPVDLCNRLSLVELAQFLGQCSAMVGNDSGPFHLGSALGVTGLVLWGPTNKAIWGPLGSQSEVVQGSFPCDPACNKGYCLHNHRCLRELGPERVFARLSTRLA